MSTSKLMKVTYYDPKSQIRLLCYADTVVWDTKPTPTLTALRFGGYPERVQGLADAIYGGATIEIEDGKDTYSLKTLTRQYRRELSHDGVYAEATLIAEDDGQSAKQNAGDKDEPDKDKNDEDDDQIQQDLPPRNTYIFCTPGERRELFDAVDQKTAVPMIPEYQDYVLTELQKRNILRPLQVKSLSRKLEAWLLRCEEKDKNIVAVMEDGLKSGAISIPGATVGLNPLDEINSITEYLNTFGVTVAERIKKLFVPLFDPATESLSPEVLAINQYIEDHAGYPLYDAQLAVAEAIKRQLERSKVGLIVAECGSGKSKIGAVSIAATAAGLLSHQMSVKVSKTFNLILCPSHVTEKWVRELEETVPNAFAAVVHTPAELDHLYQMFERGNKFCFAVLSKEKARDGYMRAPAVIYRPWNREALPIERNPPLHDGADIDGNPHKPVFCCPECGAVVMAEFTQDGVSYRVPAKSYYFRREHSGNHKCAACGAPLWSALNPDAWRRQKKWAKIGDYGFVYRPLVYEHFKKAGGEGQLQKLYEIQDHPDACFPARGAYRAYALSSYIKRKYKGKIYGLIVDELHEYRDTMQHKAIKLMASKLAVAGIIEGSFSEEGLAAMSECEDNLIPYSGNMWGTPHKDDLSRCSSYPEFVEKLNYIVQKLFMALRRDGRLAILVGDIRTKGSFYSMQHDLMRVGQMEAFIVKGQYNCVSDTRSYKKPFIPVVTEYLLLFHKQDALFFPFAVRRETTVDLRKEDIPGLTWHHLIRLTMEELSGRAKLSDLGDRLAAHPKAKKNPHFRDRIRATAYEHPGQYISCGNGFYALNYAVA